MPSMNPREIAPANANVPDSGFAARIMSIDIFRGLTVLLMVFVDNLDFVKGLPWWTYHMPRQANGMTYVDMVFPAFLFVMGMSLASTLSVFRLTADGSCRMVRSPAISFVCGARSCRYRRADTSQI